MHAELMNNVKRNGPTSELWTIPDLLDASSDGALLTQTYCALEHTNSLNQLISLYEKLNYAKQLSNCPLGTLSKARTKSSNITSAG